MYVLNPLLLPFLIFHPIFFSLSFLFLFFLFSPILIVHISFLLFHILMFFLYLLVLHMVVASLSWTVLLRSNTEPPHFIPPSHLPLLLQTPWLAPPQLTTNRCPHLSLYKPHINVCPTFDLTLADGTDRLSQDFGRGLPP